SADPNVPAEVVFVEPEVRGLAGPAGDHVGVNFSGASRGQQNPARAIAGEVTDLHDAGIEIIVQPPEDPASAVPASDCVGAQREELVTSVARNVADNDRLRGDVRATQVD